MSKSVLLSSLVFSLMGLLGFVTASLLSHFSSDFDSLAEQLTLFSAGLLIGAFFILLIAGLLLSLGYLCLGIRDFFPTQAFLERKSLFYLNKLQQQQLLYEFKKAKLIFLAQQKRKRLMQKWLSSSNRA